MVPWPPISAAAPSDNYAEPASNPAAKGLASHDSVQRPLVDARPGSAEGEAVGAVSIPIEPLLSSPMQETTCEIAGVTQARPLTLMA